MTNNLDNKNYFMHKQFINIFFIFTCIFLYTKCTTELPNNPINFDKIEVSASKSQINLLLPYNKPEGIEKIYTMGMKGIFICKIIGDGKEIKPERIWDFMGGSDDSLRYKEAYEADIDKENTSLNIKMIWRIVDDKKMSIYYKTVNGYKGKSYQYSIPYNTREVYITYRILFPYRPVEEATEEQTIYFKIDWL